MLQDNTNLAICDLKAKFLFKIAAPGEGHKPSREEYIAESEFALLGILSKECLMIHFYLDAGGQHEWKRNNKRLIVFRCEKHCMNVGRLANTTLHHYSESSKHSRNLLEIHSSCIMLRLKTLLNVFESCSLGVPTETRE